MSQWLDAHACLDGCPAVGDVGFLIAVKDTSNGGPERFSLRDNPARTNRTHEPKLVGWCGETNNRSVEARGMARVARVTSNGRVLVAPIDGADLQRALDASGYPDLAGAK